MNTFGNPAAKSNKQLYEDEVYKTFEEMFLELDSDEETKKWYYYAKKALMFASPVHLNMQTERYLEITKVEDNGINYNNVATLCNNLSMRTAHEMELSLEEYMEVMRINFNMVKYYNSIAIPIMTKLSNKYGLNQPSRILTLNNGKRN